jgi:broad specificity phosphatase PhoE
MTEVLVVQHAEKVRAAGDPGLTEVGVRQAAAVADYLRAEHADVRSVWSSPLRRAQETAAPIGACFGLVVQTDARLTERLNWDDESRLTLEAFLTEWQRTSHDRTYRPIVGDSSNDAGDRFIAAVIDIGKLANDGAVVIVAHGGVTIDALRTLVGDAALSEAIPGAIEDGVPSCALTRLDVGGDVVSVSAYPTTAHLTMTRPHRPV